MTPKNEPKTLIVRGHHRQRTADIQRHITDFANSNGFDAYQIELLGPSARHYKGAMVWLSMLPGIHNLESESAGRERIIKFHWSGQPTTVRHEYIENDGRLGTLIATEVA